MKTLCILVGLSVSIPVLLTPNQVPEVRALPSEWEKIIHSDSAEYDYRAGTIGLADDSVWVLVGAQPKGSLGQQQGYLLWHLDKNGKTILQTDLDPARRELSSGASYRVFGMSPLGKGKLAVFAYSSKTGTSLIVLNDSTGQVLRETELEPGRNLVITKVLRTSGGGVVLVGVSGGVGSIRSLGESGEALWVRQMAAEHVASIVDASPTGDGGLVVLGEVGGTKAGPISWIGRFQAKGELVAETHFAGDAQSIAGSPDGSVIVVGERPAPNGKEIWARSLTASLKERSISTVLSETKSVLPFKLAPAPGGGAVVIGANKEYLPWIGHLGQDGRLGWADTRRYDAKLVPVAGTSDVFAVSDGFVAAIGLAILDEKGAQRQTVRVLKYLGSAK